MRARNERSEEKPGRPVQRRDADTRGEKLHGPAPARRFPYPPDGASLTPAVVLGLQRSAGNAVVARLLSVEQTARALTAPPAPRRAAPAETPDDDAGAPSPARPPVQRFAVYKKGDELDPYFREVEIEKENKDENGKGKEKEEEEEKRPGTKPTEDTGEFFPSQHKKNGEWIAPGNKANIRYNPAPTLQISDNLDLAIEYDVEAKCFYATKDQLDEANKELKLKRRADISYKAGSKRLKIILADGKEIELLQVLPMTAKNGHTIEGLDVTTAQACNKMVEQVTGYREGIENMMRGLGRIASVLDKLENPDETAKFFRQQKLGDWKSWSEGVNGIADRTRNEYDRFKEAMLQKFKKHERKNPKKLKKAVESLHLNQYAETPLPGDIMITTGTLTDDEISGKIKEGKDFFGFHVGGVVATSGNDFITMENYAREMKKGITSGDPLFFFNMYGPQRRWHDVQKARRGLSGAVTSVTMRT